MFGATKVLFFNRTLAPMLGVTEADIGSMIEVDVGGGFGVRGEFYPEDFLVPFVARAVDRPVKWIEDRREHLVATNHSREVDCDLEIACGRGRTIAMRGHVCADMGAYILRWVCRAGRRRVPVPRHRADGGGLRHQQDASWYASRAGPLRGEFRERSLDIVAGDLGLDPMDFRRRNLIKEAELPFHTGKLVPYEPETDSTPAIITSP